MTARRTVSSSSSARRPRRAAARRCDRAGRRCPAPARPTPAAARRGRARGSRPPATGRRPCRPCWPRRRRGGRSGAAGRRAPRRPGAGRRARRRRARGDRRRRAPRAPGRGSSPRCGSRSRKSMPPVSMSVKRAAVPLAGDLLAVARDPGALVHDRLARAGQAVDERGLADVGIADDRDLHRVLSAARSRDDALDDLVDGQPGACRPRSRRGAAIMRRVLASCVARVALADLLHRRTPPVGARGARARRRGVRKTFSAASGATTVPMSRPSATQSPTAMSARCLSTQRGPHGGVGRATAMRPRRSPACGSPRVTSSPSSSTRSPLDASAVEARADRAARRGPTQRYMAPVSR